MNYEIAFLAFYGLSVASVLFGGAGYIIDTWEDGWGCRAKNTAIVAIATLLAPLTGLAIGIFVLREAVQDRWQ